MPFKGRVETLLKNGFGGLVLVFLVLVLFLRPAVAIWVSVGIAVAFLGAFLLLPYTGVGLNMISLFAFLLVLGIVVDDAIIVGESIHTTQMTGLSGEHRRTLRRQGSFQTRIVRGHQHNGVFRADVVHAGRVGSRRQGIPDCRVIGPDFLADRVSLDFARAPLNPRPGEARELQCFSSRWMRIGIVAQIG